MARKTIKTLSTLVREGVTVLTAIKAMPRRALSADAMIAEACKAAGVKKSDLRDLQGKLGVDYSETATCVRRLERVVLDQHVGETPAAPKCRQLIRAYAGEDRDAVRTQLQELEVDERVLVALAIRNACRRKPSRFGSLESMEQLRQHDAEYDALTEQLADICRRLPDSVKMSDLKDVHPPAPTSLGERPKPVATVFRQWPGCQFTKSGDWPLQLLRVALANEPVEEEESAEIDRSRDKPHRLESLADKALEGRKHADMNEAM